MLARTFILSRVQGRTTRRSRLHRSRFEFRCRRAIASSLGLASLLVSLGCSESGERPLSPEDVAWSSEDLTSVSVFTSSHAVIVTSNGSIYHSSDTGLTWRRSYADPEHPLHDVSIGAGGRGFAVGDARILATSDGGQSWSVQVLPAEIHDARLRAVARVDASQAVAVGLSGVRLVTSNAGALWRDRGLAIESPTPRERDERVDRSLDSHSDLWPIPHRDTGADLFGVICRGDPDRRCISFGAPGGTSYSTDGGETWTVSRRASPISFAPLEMSERSVEMRVSAKQRLVELAQRLLQSPAFEIRIAPVASETEIERVARAKDPEALFEILELRARDVRTILEEVGVDANSIRVAGTPPWDYGELIDEDPEILERYYRQRRADSPGVVVSVSLMEPLDDGAFGKAGAEAASAGNARVNAAVAATSRLGTLWDSADGGESFELSSAQPPEKVVSAFASGHEIWLASVGGSLRAAEAVPSTVVNDVDSAGTPITQRILRAADFSRSGDLGLSVGDDGALLRFVAADSKWEAVEPEDL